MTPAPSTVAVLPLSVTTVADAWSHEVSAASGVAFAARAVSTVRAAPSTVVAAVVVAAVVDDAVAVPAAAVPSTPVAPQPTSRAPTARVDRVARIFFGVMVISPSDGWSIGGCFCLSG